MKKAAIEQAASWDGRYTLPSFFLLSPRITKSRLGQEEWGGARGGIENQDFKNTLTHPNAWHKGKARFNLVDDLVKSLMPFSLLSLICSFAISELKSEPQINRVVRNHRLHNGYSFQLQTELPVSLLLVWKHPGQFQPKNALRRHHQLQVSRLFPLAEYLDDIK